MEAANVAPAGGAARDGPRAALLREPLFWGAVAAFSGTALGLFGLIRQATLWDFYYIDPLAQLLADVPSFTGEALVMLSLLGIVYLLRRGPRGIRRRMVVSGVMLLALLVAAEVVGIASSVYWNTGNRELRAYGPSPFSGLETASFWAVVFLPSAVLLPFAAVSFLGCEKRIGALISALCVLAIPFGMLGLLIFPPGPDNYVGPFSEIVFFVVGWYPGISLLEAPLWILLGVVFLRRARGSALGEAFRVQEKENLEAARRVYGDGLGRGDASVVDDLVSEDFRDLGRGSRGKLAMERVFSALWKSYPDLAVSIEEQEAEDDLVRTRLVLSGTDRGGVLWYPPTGRRVTFTADFADRFSDGKLIEHSGRADTEGLLRQLGLTRGDATTPGRGDEG